MKFYPSSKVRRLLADPDNVVHYAELMRPLSANELLQIWFVVKCKPFVDWAHNERQKSDGIRWFPGWHLRDWK